MRAITVTNTKKPTNDAPTTKASVPPPVPESEATVAPERRPAGPAGVSPALA